MFEYRRICRDSRYCHYCCCCFDVFFALNPARNAHRKCEATSKSVRSDCATNLGRISWWRSRHSASFRARPVALSVMLLHGETLRQSDRREVDVLHLSSIVLMVVMIAVFPDITVVAWRVQWHGGCTRVVVLVVISLFFLCIDKSRPCSSCQRGKLRPRCCRLRNPSCRTSCLLIGDHRTEQNGQYAIEASAISASTSTRRSCTSRWCRKHPSIGALRPGFSLCTCRVHPTAITLSLWILRLRRQGYKKHQKKKKKRRMGRSYPITNMLSFTQYKEEPEQQKSAIDVKLSRSNKLSEEEYFWYLHSRVFQTSTTEKSKQIHKYTATTRHASSHASCLHLCLHLHRVFTMAFDAQASFVEASSIHRCIFPFLVQLVYRGVCSTFPRTHETLVLPADAHCQTLSVRQLLPPSRKEMRAKQATMDA